MELFAELLSLWHEHRLELMVVAGVVLAFARFYHHNSSEEHKEPAHEKAEAAGLLFTREGSKDKVAALPIVRPNPASRTKFEGPKRFTGTRKSSPDKSKDGQQRQEAIEIEPIIFYFSLGGSTAKLAERLSEQFASLAKTELSLRTPQLHNLVEIDFDDYFASPEKTPASLQRFYMILIPTYNIDSELTTFIDSLADTHNDFRIDTAPLSRLAGYSIFGVGDVEGWPTEQDGFCTQAAEVDKWMARLTGKKRAYPTATSDIRAAEKTLAEWQTGVSEVMTGIAAGNGLGEGVEGSGEALESDEEDFDSEPSNTTQPNKKRKRPSRTTTTDLEDIRAPTTTTSDLEIDFTTRTTPTAPKEMVPLTSPTYTALTKQGYTIVGSHSGVKLCRWTKSALRGRGSCYKYSFYGIASHRCMESTPSLSCSNKCVFCWRHGTNPVSTTWRWTVDPADLVFEGIKKGHYQKIKMMRGVPGVRAERFQEAMRIRHCALSLVGEPIFYPHINELLGMLHSERISSFLVCNAQHPEQLERLAHVTQLYVSIDAATKEGLKRIDRPLHRDYWERFLRCMDILREKRDVQRTVFRLTLVKGFNIEEEVEGYADLVERARPGFVEVKGVTYCGTSTSAAAGLTMQNVPFYEEVCAFVEALNRALERRGLGYGIAAEHAHSCCILMGERERFYRKDGWHTLIDYERFFECLESGKEFGPQDYVGEKTPEWALYGNGGFDPRDERVDRKGRPKEVPQKERRVVEI
ncbi:S-adenosyl-L-methionine-dependent tRNA 4-demethylwyosine synthase [Elsinoe australis]|uniref:tRNA 4-demethylwyosine synthase (AdoMet-dependent) n=1 Tax=Elsinoe australis TaxID=40998 RepID=A0A2P7Z1L3_9PEZI|nr:S-adenosyl-L-methionine-dependent tRNA 4-demethylwyosine synthase [Elsinoe australis]